MKLLKGKIENTKHSLFTQHNIPSENIRTVYTTKIKKITDRKIAEFNYKVINNILPCNKNLTKWRIINDEKCPACNLTHNIVHMLYECCHSRRLWATVSATLGINVSTDKILVGCQN